MEWLKEYENFCNENKIGSVTYMSAIGANRKNDILAIEKKRKEALKAMVAVKHAWNVNPHASQKQMRKEAYKFVTGGVILAILLQALLSVTMKLAIDYFLDKLFSEEADDEALPLSTK